MRTLDPGRTLAAVVDRRPGRAQSDWMFLIFVFVLLAWAGLGCNPDVAREASDSDANGYLCLKCGVKLYTDRSVFIGPKCSKCGEDTLVEVVGYRCAKDQFVTIRPARGDGRGVNCEKCQASLANTMFLPRARDLRTWGATKTSQ
jgi:hypothetical protein